MNFSSGFRFRSILEVDYKYLQKLGSGGNSDVFLVMAETGTFRGVLFALKVFRRILDPDRLERFEREFRFLKDNWHPAIMTVVDNGRVQVQADQEALPFVVAEYLPSTLSDKLKNHIPLLEKISYSMQLISALTFLSKLQDPVIHRDIKPANIFIKGRSCILGDFGLMKLVTPGAPDDSNAYTQTIGPGMPMFHRTPDLVEYAKGNGVLTVKSDAFQLGLVLAELFCGENPLISTRRRSILDDVKLRKLRPIQGNLGVQIEAEINAMLTIDTATRPNAEELFDKWQGIFDRAVFINSELEGKVFN